MDASRRHLLAVLASSASSWHAAVHATDGNLKLGQSAPLSGPFAALGADYRDGALLAFEELNRQGGIEGRRVQLITLDDANVDEKAAANAHQLVNQRGVLCCFNHMFTNTVRASLPIAIAAGVPYVGPYTGAPDLYRGDKPLLFLTRASFADELSKLLAYITTVGYARVALVFYETKVGEELRDEVQAGLEARGARLLARAGMPLGGSAEAASATIAHSAPDAVILGVSGNDAVSFIKAQAAKGQRPAYFARSLVSSKQLHDQLGPLATGVVVSQLVPSPFKPQSAVVREYLRLLENRTPGGRPNFVEFEGFINARLMVVALQKAAPNVTRDSLSRTLAGLGRVDLGGYVIDFSGGNRVGSRYVELTMLRSNGTFVQ